MTTAPLVGQSMNGLDIDSIVRCVVHCCSNIRFEVTRPDRREPPMVDVDEIGCCCGYFANIQCCVDLRYDPPRVHMGGRFTGQVAGVEFDDSGVEVVEVECDRR